MAILSLIYWRGLNRSPLSQVTVVTTRAPENFMWHLQNSLNSREKNIWEWNFFQNRKKGIQLSYLFEAVWRHNDTCSIYGLYFRALNSLVIRTLIGFSKLSSLWSKTATEVSSAKANICISNQLFIPILNIPLFLHLNNFGVCSTSPPSHFLEKMQSTARFPTTRKYINTHKDTMPIVKHMAASVE